LKGTIVRKVRPVSPGALLEEEFLIPFSLSKYRLAKNIGVPALRIERMREILSEIKRFDLLGA
jgi:plasmid maintenance system antidote protein VapI